MVKEYFRPRSVAEAIELKGRIPGARYLAGGSSILSSQFHGKDIVAISLASVLGGDIRSADGVLEIGSLASFQEIADSGLCPSALREAALGMKNRAVRNRATIGGNVCANKSSSSLIPVLLVLDAEAILAGDGKAIPLAGLLESTDPPLIASFRIWIDEGRTCAYARWSRTANDLAIVSSAASLIVTEAPKESGGGGAAVKAVRLALGGVSKTVVRIPFIETFLEGRSLPEKIVLEGEIAKAVSPIGDQRGGADFKRHIASTLGAQTIFDAASGAGHHHTAVFPPQSME